METSHISLFELNKLVQSRLSEAIPESHWIIADIAQLKENFNGHCYLELVETSGKANKIVAQAKAIIFSSTWRMLKPYFETTTKQRFREGLKVLIKVKVEFHEIYGLSLNVFDIDPTYTVGELALKKAEIVKRLQDEGIFDMNRELEMPLVPQRIAIISSETAAGYTDFITHIHENPYGYSFQCTLFQSYMQGERTEQTIIDALDRINEAYERFDVVVLIRGGGSQTDLSAFDSYWMAVNLTQFPLPIITGIGHEENESVADMVAHTALKTPTAVADYLIEKVNEFESSILDLEQRLTDYVTDKLEEEKSNLSDIAVSFPLFIKDIISTEKQKVQTLSSSISSASKGIVLQQWSRIQSQQALLKNNVSHILRNKEQSINGVLRSTTIKYFSILEKQRSQLNLYSKTIELSNPQSILNKGYSITTHKEKILKNTEGLEENELIETMLSKGKFSSKVIKH